MRVKSGKYLVRTSRQDISRGFRRPGEHRFYRMEMTYTEALKALESLDNRIAENPIAKDVLIKNYNPAIEVDDFQMLYNTIFFTSPDPTREISRSDAESFPAERTFIAWLYNKMVGFIYLTIEDDPLETGETVGAIGGVGVLSMKRGKKIGAKLLERAINFFKDKEVSKLICEVYEKNADSLRMFRGLGMVIVGEMILEEVQPEDIPPEQVQ